MHHLRNGGRRRWLAPLVVVMGLVASGCATGPGSLSGGGPAGAPKPVTLIVSDTWVADNQSGSGGGAAAGGTDVASRLGALQEAIDRLRKATGTGWVGRQDDVTGYLTELSGGSWPGSPTEFMDEYGTALFGVGSSVLRLGEPDSRTVPGIVTTRATQALGEVPVLEGSLVFVARDDRLTAVRGRVFPGLSVPTTPVVTAEKARRIVERRSRGTAQAPPALVVMPRGSGVLAWEVLVAAPSDGTTPLIGAKYYVDAASGDILSVRPVAGEGRTALPFIRGAQRYLKQIRSGRTPQQAVAADARDVEVTGPNPVGGTLTGHGLQTGDGVQLVDTTTPWYDEKTGDGAVVVFDATGLKSPGQLPGKLFVSPSTKIRDGEAIAAQALSRDIVDYYASLGRESWDGKGGSLRSSVHYGRPDYCNSMFTRATEPPVMVYGNACTVGGDPQELTEVDIDTAGHEVTHGVTDTSAGLRYTGQSGALNESFSDYFGNVIGNRVTGSDSVAVFEGSCTGITEPTLLCLPNPDGSLSLRYMLNGNGFDDYLRVLDGGFRLELLGYVNQDRGGVHLNSAIWNNALWSIRSRLAKIDNLPGNDSPLAQAFDKVVYGALASRLTPTSGFLDARSAVEQVIIDSQLDPVVLRVAREVFDQEKICAGCPDTGELGGEPVDTSPSTQLHPVVSGDSVAWLDVSGDSDVFGYAASTRVGGGTPTKGSSSDVVDLAFSGDALITFDFEGRVTRYAPDGSSTRLATDLGDPTLAAGLAGSDGGGAWADGVARVSYVDKTGQVTSSDVPGLRGDTITGLGAGAGVVGIGTDGGSVLLWHPGTGPTPVGNLPGAVLSVAAYGNQVAAVDDEGNAAVFTADGQKIPLSGGAAPFGVAMNDRYVVWAERKGDLGGGVATTQGVTFPETDLYLASLSTGKVYDLVPEGGQQGFPSLSGNRLVWQDAAFGGDDVLTVEIPDDL